MAQPSLAEISVIFLYKAVYRSSSAPISSASTINLQCVLITSPKAKHSISKTVATKINFKKSII